MAEAVKNLCAMRETWVHSLGQEDDLQKGMPIHSCILAWRIPWTEDPERRYNPWGRKEFDTIEQLTLAFTLVVWWLRFLDSNAGGMGLIPDQGIKGPQASECSQKA